MNLQSKKARVPIAALGVTALIAAGGLMGASSALAVTALDLLPDVGSATITNLNVASSVTTNNAATAYTVKVGGDTTTATKPLRVNVTGTTSGSILVQSQTANTVAAADGTATLTLQAGVSSGATSIPTTTTAGIGQVLKITEALKITSYVKVTNVAGAGSPYMDTLSTETPLLDTYTTGAVVTIIGTTSAFVPVKVGGPDVSLTTVTGYANAGGDSIYLGSTYAGTYTVKIYQDNNNNGSLDPLTDFAARDLTLNVKDVTGSPAAVTTDDLSYSVTAPPTTALSEVFTPSVTLGDLTKVDFRGAPSSVGVLGTKLAVVTNFAFSGVAGVANDGAPTFDGAKFTRASGTPGAAGTATTTVTIGTTGSAAGSTTVVDNAASGISAAAVTPVTGTIVAGTNTAGIMTGTAAATYTATVVDGGAGANKSDDIVYFTLTPLVHTPVLSATGTLISTDAVTGVKVYSAYPDATTGTASITVTSAPATAATTYTVRAKTNGISSTALTATYADSGPVAVAITSSAAELTSAPTGTVTIKGKLTDQFGSTITPAGTLPQSAQLFIGTASASCANPSVSGAVPSAATANATVTAGMFSFAYTPTVAPTAGQCTKFALAYDATNSGTFTNAGIYTEFVFGQINWANSTAAATVTLSYPVEGATAVALQSGLIAPAGTAVTGTVADSGSVPLAYKFVTLSGDPGVLFSSQPVPDATHMLTKTLDAVTDSSGAITGAYVFYTKAGVMKVTATAGAAVKSASITTAPYAANTQSYVITIDNVTGAPGASLGVQGKVLDIFGNPVYNETVDLSIGTSTVGTLADSGPETNAAGVFSTTFVSSSTVSGTNVVPITATLHAMTTSATLIPHTTWAAAGITLVPGHYQAAGTVTVKPDTLTLMSTGALVGGGVTELSGRGKPDSTVTVFAKPSGGVFGVLTVVVADSDGDWGYSTSIKKSTSFYVQSGTLTSTVATTLVYSKVSLTAKAYKKGWATLSANGAPNVKGSLVFYRSIAGPDIKLKTITSNTSGNKAVIVKLPKGTRSVYVEFKAPGTGIGRSAIVHVKVK